MQVVTHASEGTAEEALHSAAAGGFASADGHATVAAARAHAADDAAVGIDGTIPITGHLPALDGLRGLAVLVVMVCHFTAPMQYAGQAGFVVHEVLNAGWVGVDLFFVLSGFLITGILFDAKGGGGYFRNFYWRRTLRIFPLYYAVLLAACVIAPLLAGQGLRAQQSWLWLYAQNFYPLFGGGEALRPAGAVPLQFSHLWSLAVEEHFYLIWPAVVFFASRRTLLRVSAGLMATALALRIGFLAAGASWEVLYKVTFLRMDALAAGAWVAAAARGPGGIAGLLRPARRVLLACAALVVITFIYDRGMNRSNPFTATVGYSVIAVSCASILVLAVALPQHVLTCRALTCGGLLWLGKYSYGLYIIHGLLRPWFAGVAPIPARPMSADLPYLTAVAGHLALAFGVSMALAWLSYHLFEKHFLKLKGHFAPHQPHARPPLPLPQGGNFRAVAQDRPAATAC